MSFRIAESEVPGRLLLGGQLTVEHAAKIREELIRAFQQAERVVLTVGEDAVPDLSFLQLLCAARRTALQEKKSFELDSAAAPKVHVLLQEAGYHHGTDDYGWPSDNHTAVEGGGNGQENHDR